MRWAVSVALAASLALAGCVAGDVGPINTLTSQVGQSSPEFIPEPGDDGSTVVGLAFSGGGMRAAAFAYGVLRELDDTIIDEQPATRSLADNIRMISGASGGAVAASYFGYRGRDDYRDFRERFLIRTPKPISGNQEYRRSILRARSTAASTTATVSPNGSTTTSSMVRPTRVCDAPTPRSSG